MKVAVILFNLGGPDKLENVEPFLFNLFNDPAILNLPSFIRYPLAKLISKKRAPIAKDIYKEIGGSSPILKLTQDQAESLEKSLNRNEKAFNYKVFITMRCWHPRASETIKLVKDFNSLISTYAHKPYLTKEQIQLSESFVAHIAKGGFSPRTDLEVDHDILNFLIENKEVVQVADGIVFCTSIFEEMVIGLRTYISQNGEITVGDFRDLYKTSRKYALAVMDYLDQQQITKRVGDARILRE